MHFLTVLPFFLATVFAAAAGDRVSTPAAASVPKVCTIKASGGVAPCRYCPKTTCGVKMYVYNSAEFVCWKDGDLENGIVYWDKTADGCWVNEFYIQNFCWQSFTGCPAV